MHVQQSVVRSQLQPREPATRRMRKTHKTQRGPAKSPSCPAPAVHGLGQVRAFLAGMGTVHLDPASLTRTKQRLRFAKRKRSPSRFRAPPCSRRDREIRNLLAVLRRIETSAPSVVTAAPSIRIAHLASVSWDESTTGWCDFPDRHAGSGRPSQPQLTRRG
jgi:hypothetical protein